MKVVKWLRATLKSENALKRLAWIHTMGNLSIFAFSFQVLFAHELNLNLKNKYIIFYILKHSRQFVQSDWFLPPVFISHDKGTASDAPDWSIQTQGFIFILKVTASYFKSFLVKVYTYFWKCLRMIIMCLRMEWLGLCPRHST